MNLDDLCDVYRYVDEEIEIKYKGTSALLVLPSSHAIILQEVHGEHRSLVAIVDMFESKNVRRAMYKSKVASLQTYDLMLCALTGGSIEIKKALIYDIRDGRYFVNLYLNRADGTEYVMDVKLSDALILSFRNGFPIYVYDSVLETERVHAVNEDGTGFSLSLNAVGTDLLKQNLEIAVKEEDFETAAQLRDEISRRENLKKS